MNLKKILCTAGLGLAPLTFLTINASAQDKSLDEVVVTASRSPKKITEIGKVVRVITAETLSKSQGRSLPEVLNNVAGLTIGGNGNNPAEVKSVYLRGASAANTLILIDGIPVNDASEISGEYNISAIAIDQIERIEIMKGGNSTLYGSDAVAGVINIITKKGEGKVGANLMATAGSYQTYKQMLGLSGAIGQTSVAFNASNLDSKGFSTALPGPGQINPDKDGFHQRGMSLNLGQDLSETFSLRANFQANTNQADLDGGAFNDSRDYDYNKSSFVAGLGARLALADKGALSFHLSQNNISNFYDNRGSITSNKGKITHLEGNFNYRVATFADLASGVTYRFSKTSQYNAFSPQLFADNNIKSLFTSLFLRTNTGLQAEIGGRINDHSQYGTNFTYTLNPSYLIADNYKLYVNVASAYRVPSLYQLYSQYGNLNLEPETSLTYEAGFDLNFSVNFNLALSVFQREIDDLIDFGQVTPGTFGYINQNKQKDKGYEIEALYRPLQNLTFNAFYAYVEGMVVSPAGESANLFRRPKNSFGMTGAYNINEKVGLTVIYKYTGDRRDRYFDNSTFLTVDADMPAYHMVDVYIQYRPVRNLTLFTDVKNLLDQNYTDFAGYATKGLNFNAGFRVDFR